MVWENSPLGPNGALKEPFKEVSSQSYWRIQIKFLRIGKILKLAPSYKATVWLPLLIHVGRDLISPTRIVNFGKQNLEMLTIMFLEPLCLFFKRDPRLSIIHLSSLFTAVLCCINITQKKHLKVSIITRVVLHSLLLFFLNYSTTALIVHSCFYNKDEKSQSY